jgi:photosystem II stability/assembly factor-like uncharacterized protein
VGAGLLVVACSSIAPTPRPTRTAVAPPTMTLPSPTVAPGWTTATVEQPETIEIEPTDAPGFCSPCHPIVGTYIRAVVSTPAGYLALGSQLPPAHAAAWTSTDATAWRRIPNLPAPDSSDIDAAVAVGSTLLAVGSAGGSAAVWRTDDGGRTWALTTPTAPPAGSTERLTAIAAVDGGYVAAGYTQDALAVRTASFWRSTDGSTWTRVAAPVETATEVTGLAGSGGVVMAVGISGNERRGTAAAWRSTDGGSSWTRLSSADLSDGRMLAVAAGSGGFAAVGENVDQTAAAAWISTDGSTWSAVPDQDAFANGGLQMVVEAVAADPGGGFVADGWRSDAGNGSAVVWRSPDGRTWTRLPQDNAFSGAGMAAILASPRLLCAGTKGWPDTHAAEVWIPPAM